MKAHNHMAIGSENLALIHLAPKYAGHIGSLVSDESSLAGFSTPATFLIIEIRFFAVGVILHAATRQRYEIL